MPPHRTLSSVVVAIALTTGLVSCADVPPAPDFPTPSSRPSTFDGSVPDFSGPWAAEFAEAYRSTSDEVVLKILEKESITDQDYATVAARFVKCMANKGFTVQIDGPAGEMTISDLPTDEDGRRANVASNACDTGWGELCALRNSLLRNPENLDENTIMAACVVRQKIAPPSYTATEYAHDLETWTFPYSTSSMEFHSCIGDPLGLGSGG